jgi:hypothetical protein
MFPADQPSHEHQVGITNAQEQNPDAEIRRLTVQEIVEEWNTRAKAEGRYLDKDPWSIPPAAGSLLDIPETPESRERIAWLNQQIAELQRQQQDREEAAIKKMTGAVAPQVQSPVPKEPALEEQPPATNRAS